MTITSHDQTHNVATGIACGLTAALIWGAWPVASRLGVQQSLDTFDITALRFAVAGAVLLPFVLKQGMRGIGWGRALVLTAGAGVPYVVAAIGGLSFAPASHGGVITPSTMLITSTLGGWLLLGERLTRTRLTGTLIIISGVALIGWNSMASTDGDLWIGHLMFVAAGALWATYTLAARAWLVDPIRATALVSVFSMVLVLPAYAVLGDGGVWRAPISEIFFQGIFQGLFASILALLAYTRAVAVFGAGRGAVFATLVPGIAVLLAYPVLGEAPGPSEIAGAITVTLGMIWALGLFTLRRPRSAAATCDRHKCLVWQRRYRRRSLELPW